MKNFRVIWEIDIEAETAREAAEDALKIQRNPNSIATVFNVVPEDGDMETIDVEEE